MTTIRRSGHRPGYLRSLLLTLSLAGLAALGPSPASAAAPGNDDFPDAQTAAPLPFEDTRGTRQATLESGEPNPSCAPIGRTVWYSFTPTSDTILRADTTGSEFDTVLAVWTGSDLATLSEERCNDDVSPPRSSAWRRGWCSPR